MKGSQKCQILLKKIDDDYKKAFANWQLAIDELNEYIKVIENAVLEDKDIKIEMGFLSFLDDGKKKYEEDEEHEFIIFMYGAPLCKTSTYIKEREIFRRFDKQKTLYWFELYKRRLIIKEKNKLFERQIKEDSEKERQRWDDFFEKTFLQITADVNEEYKKT